MAVMVFGWVTCRRWDVLMYLRSYSCAHWLDFRQLWPLVTSSLDSTTGLFWILLLSCHLVCFEHLCSILTTHTHRAASVTLIMDVRLICMSWRTGGGCDRWLVWLDWLTAEGWPLPDKIYRNARGKIERKKKNCNKIKGKMRYIMAPRID